MRKSAHATSMVRFVTRAKQSASSGGLDNLGKKKKRAHTAKTSVMAAEIVTSFYISMGVVVPASSSRNNCRSYFPSFR